MGYEPISLISLSFFIYKLHFSVRCTKVFDIFGNSLILLNVIFKLMNIIFWLYDLPYQGSPFVRQFINIFHSFNNMFINNGSINK